MSAKSGNIALDNITRNLNRVNLPRLPPAPGFDGDEEFREQVQLWKKWIAWEKDDPLVLKEDEPKSYTQRVMYCYKQALMAMRFWPEMWVDAAEWCYENDIRENEKEMGTEFLTQGIAANPESVLLALKYADKMEATYPGKEGDKSEYAKAVRHPYDNILDTLYAMGDKVKEREKLEVSTLKQAAANEPTVHESVEANDDEDSDKPKLSATEQRIQAIQQGYATESQTLSRTISYVWIALARAMRRIQGKGNQTEGGLRKVFIDARKKGRLTSDVYVAVALLESVVYKDPVGSKIFERGAKLFPNDEGFMIEYLRFLHSKDDTTSELHTSHMVKSTTNNFQMPALSSRLASTISSPSLKHYRRPSRFTLTFTNMNHSTESCRKSPNWRREWQSYFRRTRSLLPLQPATRQIDLTPSVPQLLSPRPFR